MEAVKANVEGVAYTIEATIDNGVQRLVVLSTDKALYSINAIVMSMTLMEKVMVAKSRNVSRGGIKMCSTWNCNVMTSHGSVIPLFIRQIKAGLPITVTDTSMSRFMMSLPDVVGLVHLAYEYCEQGDFFFQKAPAATVEELAWTLHDIFGPTNEIKAIETRAVDECSGPRTSGQRVCSKKDPAMAARLLPVCSCSGTTRRPRILRPKIIPASSSVTMA